MEEKDATATTWNEWVKVRRNPCGRPQYALPAGVEDWVWLALDAGTYVLMRGAFEEEEVLVTQYLCFEDDLLYFVEKYRVHKDPVIENPSTPMWRGLELAAALVEVKGLEWLDGLIASDKWSDDHREALMLLRGSFCRFGGVNA